MMAPSVVWKAIGRMVPQELETYADDSGSAFSGAPSNNSQAKMMTLTNEASDVRIAAAAPCSV